MTTDTPARVRKNPYVGPRAFRAGEPLYGRERECRELTDLLIAERILLLHSPSGAGKTSLIQSRVIPELAREGFVVSPTLRVNTLPTRPVANRWVCSAMQGLVGEDRLDKWPGLEDMTMAEVLDRLDYEQSEKTERVLVFDQFEEILRLEPADWQGQSQFFKQLGDALADVSRFALFSMREDFVGGLDRYLCYLPGQLRTWYRLDFLQRAAALRAIQKPAEEWDTKFTDEGAEQLFDDLATVDFAVPGGEREKRVGPYVEPVHLQVACHRLWRALKKRRSGVVGTITAEDVDEFADIDTILAGFYSDAVAEVVTEHHANENVLRDWFDHELITPERWRSQTRTGPNDETVDVTGVLTALEDRYLIRSDQRAGVNWYELTHDRLVIPVLRSNKEWRREHFHPIEYRAFEWERTGRKFDSYLLAQSELIEARAWLHRRRHALGFVNNFIQASRERNGKAVLRNRIIQLWIVVILLFGVVLLEAVLIYYMWGT
jgi:hypothetical protein